jgi:hypothetical protein
MLSSTYAITRNTSNFQIAPVLKLGKVLAERGYQIEFATLEG